MRSSLSTSLAVLGCVLVLGACSGGSGGGKSPTSPLGVDLAGVEFDSFGHLNTTREENDIEPQLDLRERVAQVARRHSESMRDAGFMAHVDPQGRNVGDRLRQAGISFRTAAENLAQVTHAGNPAAYAHELLLASDGHRQNILDPRFELVGVGVARQGDAYWITQIFIGL